MKILTKNTMSTILLATVIAFGAAAAAFALFSAPVRADAADGKTADVFMIAGQSNAAGSTLITSTATGIAQPYAPTENVLYYGGTHKTVSGGSGRYFNDFRPVQHGCGYTDQHVGFEIGMARLLNERPEYTGADRKAVIFKSAAGGTSVFPDGNYGSFGNWYPKSLWENDYYTDDYFNIIGFQYRTFMTVFDEFLRDLRKEGYTEINIKGLFWMQGETDRGRPDDYLDVCKVLFEDFRADISEKTGQDYSDMPIYVGEISKTFSSAAQDSVNQNLALIEAQHKLASHMRNVYVAPLKDYLINEMQNNMNVVVGSDSSHWNYGDIMNIGKDFVRLYDETYDKTTGYAALTITGSNIAVSSCSAQFDGPFGPNYAAGTEKLTLRIKTQTRYTLTGIAAEGADYKLADKIFEDDSLAPVYVYEISGFGDQCAVQLEFGNNRSYRVTSSTPDKTYGSAPSEKVIENAYLGCKYTFMTYPNSSGAVYKLIINGHEVYGQKDVIKYTFDDWEEKYVDDDDKTIHIEVVYGEKSEVDRLLDEYYSGSSDNPDDAGDNSETGASCGGCSSGAASVYALPGLITLIAAAALAVVRSKSGR